eukprot:2473546-Karenia_brevis.AAC.1
MAGCGNCISEGANIRVIQGSARQSACCSTMHFPRYLLHRSDGHHQKRGPLAMQQVSDAKASLGRLFIRLPESLIFQPRFITT